MGKKQFIKDAKSNNKKSKQHQTPTTADEYLEAGVEFEEAGEKWRGGDAAKSARFFTRAIDAYDEGLGKFPGSFDLAYNKARVQYELTQHPKLAAYLPGPSLSLLETALRSSRYALSLKQDNADVLFNTAQVLTSLVEAATDAKSSALEPIPLLEESIELFQRCITLQEYQLTESISQAEQASTQTLEQDQGLQAVSDTEEGGVSISGDTDVDSQPPQDTQWATIIEPVTNDTLLDTLLAQLEPLTILCTLITNDEGQGLAWIEEYTNNLLNQKLPIYVQPTGREQEASLIRANFISALAEANFRTGRIDIQTYQGALEDAFGNLDIANDPKGLVDKAEALISYNTAIRNADEAGILNLVRWKSVTTALECLTNASKLPTASNLSKIHIARGDAELLRYRLGQPPSNYDIATKNGHTLLKNAEKFYRGASAVARAEGETNEISEAVVKEALAKALGGDAERWTEVLKEEKSRAQEVVQDAVDDGLIFIDGRAAFSFV